MKWKWPLIWSDERGGWWRVLVTYVLFGGFFLVLGFVLNRVFYYEIQNIIKNWRVDLKAGVQMFRMTFPLLCSGVGCLLGIKLVHHMPVSCVFTDGRPFQIGLFLQSSFVWAVLWLSGVVLFPRGLDELSERFHEIPLSSWPGFFLVSLIVWFFQAATEEIIDRGYLQTRVAAWVKRPWLAVCISTSVFTMLHIGEMTPAARFEIFSIGLVLGIALIRANTIAPLIGLHWMHNALTVIFLPNRSNANLNLLDAIYISIQLTVWLAWLFWVTRKDHQSNSMSRRSN